MPQNSGEIVVAGNGDVYVAPVGTAAPADASAAYAAGWKVLGFTNEDGVTFNDSKDVEDIGVWQSFYPARQIVTARSSSVSFSLRQWNEDTVPLAFGGGAITTVSAGQYKFTPPTAETIDQRALSVEWKDGTKTFRLFIPKGMVTEAVETNVNRSSPADLPITFSVLATGSGDPWYLLTNSSDFAT